VLQEPTSIIVLVLDRLGAAYLGPYGNTWLDTPNFCALAQESTLFETAIADAVSLQTLYRSYWYGVPAWCGASPAEHNALAAVCSQAGRFSLLLTDSREVAEAQGSQAFHQTLLVPSDPRVAPCDCVEAMQVARVLATAVDRFNELKRPFLLWVHAQAMQGPWDAPQSLRDQFAEEGDPAPSDCVAVPNAALDRRQDPDRLLSLTHAYAGQVAGLDLCLGPLHEAVRSQHDSPTLLIVTAPRGLALGEHGQAGPSGDELYAELLQVPLLVRWPAGRNAARRIHRPVEPVDLHATLTAMVHDERHAGTQQPPSPWGDNLLSITEQWPRSEPSLDYVCSRHAAWWSVRTPVWFYRESTQPDVAPQLYAKPDDRFEVNEVADRCSNVIVEFHEALERIQKLRNDGQTEKLPSLERSLLEEVE
jgi:arylsulfatase A-like enzyme